jgi:hypothetical protein
MKSSSGSGERKSDFGSVPAYFVASPPWLQIGKETKALERYVMLFNGLTT